MFKSLLKNGLMTLALCSFATGMAFAEEGYSASIEYDPLIPGGESEIYYCIDNVATMKGVQMDITLPEGLSFQENKRGAIIINETDRTEDFDISGAIQSSGALRVACLSLSGWEIEGNSGAVFSTPVNVAEDFAGGTITLTTIYLSVEIDEDPLNTESKDVDDYSTELTVTKQEVAVTSITISPAEDQEMTEGDTLDFTATVAPADATEQNVIWSISDDEVAQIAIDSTDANKVTVTALEAGEVVLTAKAAGESEVSATVNITIKAKVVDVTSITLDPSEPQTIGLNDGIQFKVTVLPEDATDSSVIWSSSEPTVASVTDEGIVTGLSNGTTVIKATSVQNPDISASCEVTVDSSVGVSSLTTDSEGYYNVFNVNGQQIAKTTDFLNILNLEKGIYIINGQKVVIK